MIKTCTIAKGGAVLEVNEIEFESILKVLLVESGINPDLLFREDNKLVLYGRKEWMVEFRFVPASTSFKERVNITLHYLEVYRNDYTCISRCSEWRFKVNELRNGLREISHTLKYGGPYNFTDVQNRYKWLLDDTSEYGWEQQKMEPT